MSFFRRKDKNEIPPVGPPSGDRSGSNSYNNAGSFNRSNAATYNASRDGQDPYGNRSPSNFYSAPKSSSASNTNDPNSDRDRYGRNAGVGDPYARHGAGDANSDRQELFAGYNAERSGGRNRFDERGGGGNPKQAWRDQQPQNQEEEEEDVETIKQDTRAIKQDSVQSSRNALRLAREAEETARGTLNKLGDQSEKLANVQRHLDVAKGHTARAEDRTDELKQLNRSIFRPVITFNKDSKRAKEEARLTNRYEQERAEREQAMSDVRESQQRIGRAATYGQSDGYEDTYGEDMGGGHGRRGIPQAQQDARLQTRKRFQFEKTASDDELEDELDDNMDEISDVTKRLKALASAQGDELDRQNKRLDDINKNADKLDTRVNTATRRLMKAGK